MTPFAEHLENLSFLPDWESRYAYILELAASLPPMDAGLKTDGSLVRGCTSQVWLVGGFGANGKLNMQVDSDALLVKGLLALVYSAYQGATREEILALDVPTQLDTVGLTQHLSPNRRNGLASVVQRIRTLSQ